MNYSTIAANSGTVPLPSLMYVDFTQQPQALQPQAIPRKRPNKMHVSAACINCKKAHLACDVSRPCNRCVTTDKVDSCRDIQHKKRGRPKMPRDANNNKIRPQSSSIPSSVITANQRASLNSTTDKIMPLCPSDLGVSSDMMTIFLSMDLCCARVSDKSLQYLELYPQEFSHRSLYDFLVPGGDQYTLSKLHRCLLDNAVQHVGIKLPNNLIRSSYESFFSTPLEKLLTIANGSLTVKQKLNFRRGRDREQTMHCRFYLGGGFGVDLFKDALDQLYIVCIMTPLTSTNSSAGLIRLPPLMIHTKDPSCSTSPTTVLEQAHDDTPTVDFDDDIQSFHSNDGDVDSQITSNLVSTTPTTPTTNNSTTSANQSSDSTTNTTTAIINSMQLPLISNQEYENDRSPLLDKFQYNNKNQHHFFHPNELYYLQTTSSRLSSEAVARTASPYLSKSPSANIGGSGPLATYNSGLSK